MPKPKFWMVLGGHPTYRHPTKQSAKTEAERLAMATPCVEFVVLESLATVVTNDLRWELNTDDASATDDVPF